MIQIGDTSKAIALVIFGVTGDLTKRRLFPALYQLQKEGRLPSSLAVIGFARRSWTEDEMRTVLTEGIRDFARIKPVDFNTVQTILETSAYIQSSFEEVDGYKKLIHHLTDQKFQKVVLYLATPPTEYVKIIRNLSVCENFSENLDWVRIVVEKPYGRDLETAQELENELHHCFEENQVYRIDHYLGKETVQNILVFRFANGIFEPLWNKNYIDHVQIVVAETDGVGTRAGYFDQSGVIRDIFANHLLQLLTLVAMEAPYAFNADSVRDEKMKVLQSLRPLKDKNAIEHTVRAQYSANTINGYSVPGYLEEDKVAKESITETFLAAKVYIDNWRWAQVPFFLRSGKRLPVRATEISIQFKQIPLSLFNWKNMAGEAPNVLILRVQPDESINLTFGAKVPGPINQISPVEMEFCYADAFGSEPPEAYERLLLDCMMGDQTLFTRTDEVIEQWRFVSDILDAWKNDAIRELPKYPAGTWGPLEAEDFILTERRKWRNPK